MTAPATARSAEALIAAGLLAPARAEAVARVAERYAVAVTPHLAALIGGDDPDDPLGRQFVPSEAELAAAPGELADPIGDAARSPVKGVIHRYPDRVLLKLLHACPVYCRFCFRREAVGPGGEALDEAELEAALDYVRARPEVWEAILTGGDPLMLAARRLARVVGALDAIPHLGVVRLHSRVPIADPERVTPELVAALRTEDSAVWLAVHVNHPRELAPAARAALARLADAGIPLVSQTVLLAGVNDDPETLEALFRALVRNRVKPYYLHHPDLAPGTGHLRVGLDRGRELVRGLRGRISGLCQPTYVLDLPGGFGKVPAAADHLRRDGDGWRVADRHGAEHRYPPAPAAEDGR